MGVANQTILSERGIGSLGYFVNGAYGRRSIDFMLYKLMA
ncbi:MAG: hypothetical protein Rpha_0685 [Candidatus Ruthia sp. Apha_13_S6]|nr:hypothetical protein [Candidatus Ruthia sp. Apha_13_S6]